MNIIVKPKENVCGDEHVLCPIKAYVFFSSSNNSRNIDMLWVKN